MKRFFLIMFSIIGLSLLFVGCNNDKTGTIRIQNSSSLTITKVTISGPILFDETVTISNGESRDYKVDIGSYNVTLNVDIGYRTEEVDMGTLKVEGGKITTYTLAVKEDE